MDHLDLALSHQQEAVYSNNDEGGNSMMSERVSSLAAGVYAEFENMIQKYGQEVLENLMPMVVNLLEQLDTAFGESREQSLELEMLSEDNEQLITQYEREKQLRKLAESKYLEYEDAQDQEKRDLQAELEQFEHLHRQAESKIKSLQDHVDRLEERLSEGKKDYSSLHTRHTEMIQSYMERMEQYRRMASSVHSLADASPTAKKNVQLGTEKSESLNISSSHPNLSSPGVDTKLLQKGSTSFMSILPTMNESDNRNDLSFEDETNKPTGLAGTNKDSKLPEEAKNLSDEFENAVETMDTQNIQDVNIKTDKNVGITTSTPLKSKAVKDKDSIHKLDDKVNLPIMSYHEAERSITGTTGNAREASTNVFMSPEAEAILQTTPELLSGELLKAQSPERRDEINTSVNAAKSINEAHKTPKAGHEKANSSIMKYEEMVASQMSLDSTRLARLHEDRAFTNADPAAQSSLQAIERMNDLSLFAELSSQEPSFLGEIETANGLSAVGREMETIIKENEELLSAKTKLQTQKNDLLQRVEEISREKELVEEQMNELVTMKGRLKVRITELEQELKKTKHELEKAVIAVKGKNSEDRMSSANRKRFTRVEMARVLMERNQYKERLMELQEAVRWTEMIRASKENHLAALQQKKRSSVWKFFNNLFAGSSTPTSPQQRKPTTGQPINIWYGSTAASSASNHRRNNSIAGTVATPIEGITERQRQERKERYKHVKEHISTESRKQAYGWSLPANYSSDQEGPASVPVPVYCRPLNTESAMKIWCCAGVSLDGGRKSDGTFLGVSQEFIEPSQSTVWIGTSTHSCSKITVLDANSPSTALDQFIVCSSHLLCMTAVPGLSEEDFDANDGANDQRIIKSTKQIANLQRSRPPIGPRSYSYSSGAEMRSASASLTGRKISSHERQFDDSIDVSDVSGTLTGVQTEEESLPDDDAVDGSSPKFTSALSTMWLGAQSGKIYIHSTISNWKKCLQSAKLKDSILSIVEIKGRVLVALADGTVAIFHRKPDGRWDLSNYHLLDLGRPHHSIRCMTVVHDTVWCGYRNKVQVINPKSMTVEKSFDAHPRRESQVRQLACLGDGVWVSIRLDSTLRLYNAKTYHHLQDIDIEPYVSKMLGTGRYGYSFVRITALLLSDDRLWVGTGNGVILSVPLVAARPSHGSSSAGSSPQGGSPVHALEKRKVSNGFMPYCSMVHAQLSFHGHRDSVKFFVSVPGAASNLSSAKAYSMAGARPPSPALASGKKSLPAISSDCNVLIMSGGEGYIDFRVGDDESEEGRGADEVAPISPKVVAAERSHLLVWQISKK